jgi:hypothetical protein
MKRTIVTARPSNPTIHFLRPTLRQIRMDGFAEEWPQIYDGFTCKHVKICDA